MLVVAAPLAAVLVYNWWRALEEGRALAVELLRTNAAKVSHDLQNLRHDADWLLGHLSRRPSIRAMRASSCDDELALLTDAHPAFYLVTLWLPDGELVCRSGRPELAAAPRVRPYQPAFDEGMRTDGLLLSDVFIGPITGVALSTFTYPVKDDNGTVVGLLSLPVQGAYFDRFLEGLRRYAGGTVAIMDRAGTVAARHPGGEQWRGRKLGEFAPVAEELASPHGIRERASFDGVRRIWVWETVPALDWRVYAGLESEVLFAAYRRQFLEGAAAFLFILLVTSFLAYRLGGGIARPLRALQATTDAVAGGERWHRATVSGPQEVAAVAEHFNRMLDALTAVEGALQEMSTRLQRAQEDERRRLSRELHDNIGQALTALKLQLDMLARTSAPPELRVPLAEAARAAGDTLQSTRRIATGLRPPQLDTIGLAATLRAHLEGQAALAGFAAHVESRGLPRHLPPAVEIACFRIAQEAINNVVRHARAANVWLTLALDGDQLRFTLRDDGAGFDPGAGSGGLGLTGIRERAALAGGTLEVRSAPGGGTTVEAALPLAQGPAA